MTAEAADFRPCRRCRPDLSPKLSSWSGTAATVNRALRLIDAGVLDERSVERLAEMLGVGGRHLRRLFHQHLGCSPISLALSRRLQLAGELIEDGRLSIIEVAHASGFGSLRRFNDAFRRTYGWPPRHFRAKGCNTASPITVAVFRLYLRYQRPYDWTLLSRCLQASALPEVEYINDSVYQRGLDIDGRGGLVVVRHLSDIPYLEAKFYNVNLLELRALAERLRRMFDLDVDPKAIGDHLGRSKYLRELVRRHPGVRVSGGWSGFELFVRALIHNLAPDRAALLLRHLIETHGKPLVFGGNEIRVRRAFPTIEALAQSDLSADADGIFAPVFQAIRMLAQHILEGRLSLRTSQSSAGLNAGLQRIHGIDRRLADRLTEAILHQSDALDSSSPLLRRAIDGGQIPWSLEEFEDISEEWRPWRAYGAVLLCEGRHEGDGAFRSEGWTRSRQAIASSPAERERYLRRLCRSRLQLLGEVNRHAYSMGS